MVGLSDGSIGQLTQPFPAGAPSIKELWERETGITLEIVGLPNGQEFTKTMQDISTKAGGYDIYSVEWNRLGDLAESGGIANLDEYVATHRPEWDDPVRGYVNGEQGVALLNQYRGSTYGVSMDGDFQTWVYRTDLFTDPAEQKAFKDKFGYDLAPPRTWKQLDEIALHFFRARTGPDRLHRPAQPGLGLHQLVSALRLHGLAQPVPVRRRRDPADQLGSTVSRRRRNTSPRSPTIRPMRSAGAGRSSTATSARAARP